MKRVLIIIAIIYITATNCSAAEIDFSPPALPESGKEFLTEEPESFQSGLRMILENALPYIYPAFAEAAAICTRVTAIVFLRTASSQETGSVRTWSAN